MERNASMFVKYGTDAGIGAMYVESKVCEFSSESQTWLQNEISRRVLKIEMCWSQLH